MTGNVEVVYIAKDTIVTAENDAWKERFGKNILHFSHALPNPDKRFKVWGKMLHGLGCLFVAG